MSHNQSEEGQQGDLAEASSVAPNANNARVHHQMRGGRHAGSAVIATTTTPIPPNLGSSLANTSSSRRSTSPLIMISNSVNNTNLDEQSPTLTGPIADETVRPLLRGGGVDGPSHFMSSSFAPPSLSFSTIPYHALQPSATTATNAATGATSLSYFAPAEDSTSSYFSSAGAGARLPSELGIGDSFPFPALPVALTSGLGLALGSTRGYADLPPLGQIHVMRNIPRETMHQAIVQNGGSDDDDEGFELLAGEDDVSRRVVVPHQSYDGTHRNATHNSESEVAVRPSSRRSRSSSTIRRQLGETGDNLRVGEIGHGNNHHQPTDRHNRRDSTGTGTAAAADGHPSTSSVLPSILPSTMNQLVRTSNYHRTFMPSYVGMPSTGAPTNLSHTINPPRGHSAPTPPPPPTNPTHVINGTAFVSAHQHQHDAPVSATAATSATSASATSHASPWRRHRLRSREHPTVYGGVLPQDNAGLANGGHFSSVIPIRNFGALVTEGPPEIANDDEDNDDDDDDDENDTAPPTVVGERAATAVATLTSARLTSNPNSHTINAYTEGQSFTSLDIASTPQINGVGIGGVFAGSSVNARRVEQQQHNEEQQHPNSNSSRDATHAAAGGREGRAPTTYSLEVHNERNRRMEEEEYSSPATTQNTNANNNNNNSNNNTTTTVTPAAHVPPPMTVRTYVPHTYNTATTTLETAQSPIQRIGVEGALRAPPPSSSSALFPSSLERERGESRIGAPLSTSEFSSYPNRATAIELMHLQRQRAHELAIGYGTAFANASLMVMANPNHSNNSRNINTLLNSTASGTTAATTQQQAAVAGGGTFSPQVYNQSRGLERRGGAEERSNLGGLHVGPLGSTVTVGGSNNTFLYAHSSSDPRRVTRQTAQYAASALELREQAWQHATRESGRGGRTLTQAADANRGSYANPSYGSYTAMEANGTTLSPSSPSQASQFSRSRVENGFLRFVGDADNYNNTTTSNQQDFVNNHSRSGAAPPRMQVYAPLPYLGGDDYEENNADSASSTATVSRSAQTLADENARRGARRARSHVMEQSQTNNSSGNGDVTAAAAATILTQQREQPQQEGHPHDRYRQQQQQQTSFSVGRLSSQSARDTTNARSQTLRMSVGLPDDNDNASAEIVDHPHKKYFLFNGGKKSKERDTAGTTAFPPRVAGTSGQQSDQNVRAFFGPPPPPHHAKYSSSSGTAANGNGSAIIPAAAMSLRGNQHGDDGSFEHSWEVISSALWDIINRKPPTASYQQLHGRVFSLVVRRDGRKLYKKISGLIEDRAREVAKKINDRAATAIIVRVAEEDSHHACTTKDDNRIVVEGVPPETKKRRCGEGDGARSASAGVEQVEGGDGGGAGGGEESSPRGHTFEEVDFSPSDGGGLLESEDDDAAVRNDEGGANGDADDDAFLAFFANEYASHAYNARRIGDIMLYLDKNYCPQKGKPTVREVAKQKFHDFVFGSFVPYHRLLAGEVNQSGANLYVNYGNSTRQYEGAAGGAAADPAMVRMRLARLTANMATAAAGGVGGTNDGDPSHSGGVSSPLSLGGVGGGGAEDEPIANGSSTAPRRVPAAVSNPFSITTAGGVYDHSSPSSHYSHHTYPNMYLDPHQQPDVFCYNSKASARIRKIVARRVAEHRVVTWGKTKSNMEGTVVIGGIRDGGDSVVEKNKKRIGSSSLIMEEEKDGKSPTLPSLAPLRSLAETIKEISPAAFRNIIAVPLLNEAAAFYGAEGQKLADTLLSPKHTPPATTTATAAEAEVFPPPPSATLTFVNAYVSAVAEEEKRMRELMAGDASLAEEMKTVVLRSFFIPQAARTLEEIRGDDDDEDNAKAGNGGSNNNYKKNLRGSGRWLEALLSNPDPVGALRRVIETYVFAGELGRVIARLKDGIVCLGADIALGLSPPQLASSVARSAVTRAERSSGSNCGGQLYDSSGKIVTTLPKTVLSLPVVDALIAFTETFSSTVSSIFSSAGLSIYYSESDELTASLAKVINTNPRTAEYLAFAIDANIRSRRSEYDTSLFCEKVLKLYAMLEDRDIFDHCHQYLFSQRLLSRYACGGGSAPVVVPASGAEDTTNSSSSSSSDRTLLSAVALSSLENLERGVSSVGTTRQLTAPFAIPSNSATTQASSPFFQQVLSPPTLSSQGLPRPQLIQSSPSSPPTTTTKGVQALGTHEIPQQRQHQQQNSSGSTNTNNNATPFSPISFSLDAQFQTLESLFLKQFKRINDNAFGTKLEAMLNDCKVSEMLNVEFSNLMGVVDALPPTATTGVGKTNNSNNSSSVSSRVADSSAICTDPIAVEDIVDAFCWPRSETNIAYVSSSFGLFNITEARRKEKKGTTSNKNNGGRREGGWRTRGDDHLEDDEDDEDEALEDKVGTRTDGSEDTADDANGNNNNSKKHQKKRKPLLLPIHVRKGTIPHQLHVTVLTKVHWPQYSYESNYMSAAMASSAGEWYSEAGASPLGTVGTGSGAANDSGPPYSSSHSNALPCPIAGLGGADSVLLRGAYLPKESIACLAMFRSFYLGKHKSRILELCLAQGSFDILMRYVVVGPSPIPTVVEEGVKEREKDAKNVTVREKDLNSGDDDEKRPLSLPPSLACGRVVGAFSPSSISFSSVSSPTQQQQNGGGGGGGVTSTSSLSSITTRSVVLNVPTYMAAPLLLFESDDERLSIQQVAHRTGLPLSEAARGVAALLRQTSMHTGILRIVSTDGTPSTSSSANSVGGKPTMCTLTAESLIAFNINFKSKVKFVKVDSVHTKPDEEDAANKANNGSAHSRASAIHGGRGGGGNNSDATSYSSSTTSGNLHRAVDQARRERPLEISAQIVRAMKVNKTMAHGDLVKAVREGLQRIFVPTPEDVKKGIESLIERDFLRRNDSQLGHYDYVA